MNQLTLIGFTGQDAEIHYTQNGTPVTTLSVATTSPAHVVLVEIPEGADCVSGELRRVANAVINSPCDLL